LDLIRPSPTRRPALAVVTASDWRTLSDVPDAIAGLSVALAQIVLQFNFALAFLRVLRGFVVNRLILIAAYSNRRADRCRRSICSSIQFRLCSSSCPSWLRGESVDLDLS
jgi:hypothetical protein